jgi:hypothetical protein
MIGELLQWLQLLSVKKLVLNLNLSLRASDFILICYALVFLLNRKGCFIAVFLFCEVLAYSGFIDGLTNPLYYLLFAGIYSGLYHFLYLTNSKINTVFACAIIVIFSIGAALDAYFYPQIETIFYRSYEFFVVAVHLYLIYTLINWRSLRSAVGSSINSIARSMGINYSLSLFCCTHLNNTKKDYKV